MDKNEIEQKISEELKARRNRVLNRNALNALFASFKNPAVGLGQIFLGRGSALEAEKAKIAQNAVLDLLCDIDTALSKMTTTLSGQKIEIEGLIETHVHNADTVKGLHIASDSGPVRFKPGTHIRTIVTGNAKKVTGLQIGGKADED